MTKYSSKSSMNLSKQIQLVLTEGKNTGSHKFAFLRAILDFIVEKNPKENEDLKIPLVYFAEKSLSYYWVMFLGGTQQLVNKSLMLAFYKHFEVIINAINHPSLKIGFLEKKHVHDLWEILKKQDKLENKIISAINEARYLIHKGPVVHARNILMTKNILYLDFYEYPKHSPQRIRAKNYYELYEKEDYFITIKSHYLHEFKKMYYWLDKAILTVWAEFTDKLPLNHNAEKPTGLSLLEVPKPGRNDLKIYVKHFKKMGIKNCVYCNKKPFDSIDHVIPWSMVKSDKFWNMLPICKSCNSSKSDRIWDLNDRAKKILKKSIAIIVDNIEEHPEFFNQVKQYFIYSGEKYINDKEKQIDLLYETTLSKISDFSDNILANT